MRLLKKKVLLILYLICFSSIIYFEFTNQTLSLMQDNTFHSTRNENPKSAQLGPNITLNILRSGFIMVEGQVGLNITSANSGQIHCALAEEFGERYFLKINQTIVIIGDNQSHLTLIRIIPLITTFPGDYQFILNITGLFTYNEIFEVFLGMGYSLFTIVLGFLAVIIIIVVLKRKNANKSKATKNGTSSQTFQTSQSDSLDKINCPNCKKIIDEGLSFCPECGERIPEFLRFNPNKPG